MTRARRTVLLVFSLLITLALLACGGRPTAVPSSTEQSRSVEMPRPTEEPRPTEGASPTEQPPPPEEGGAVATPSIADAYERSQNLPGYHFEGTFESQEGAGTPTYLRLVQDLDAQGNMHLEAFDQEGGEPTLDMYYVDKHLYMGAGGRYIDMGVQEAQQAAVFYQLYQMPFTMALVGASNLEALGQEDVNGLSAIKYRASFEEWVRAYLQAEQGVSYTAEGFIWISDEYGAVVKSTVQAVVTEDDATKSFSAASEISQVGQVAPITAP